MTVIHRFESTGDAYDACQTGEAKPADEWVPACGGTEVPFTCRGRRLHYMWNRVTGEHAYYDLGCDRFLQPHEAAAILNA